MENKLLIAGFGGQGVMVMGQLLGYAYCAGGKNVTFLPAYGPEQRGGAANCMVIASDDDIGSPNAFQIDVLIAMNDVSLIKFQERVKPGGAILVNSSTSSTKVTREDVNAYYIPANDIATELGSTKASNIVMLGAYLNVSKTLSIESFIKVIHQKLGKKPEMLKINEAAVSKGIELTSR